METIKKTTAKKAPVKKAVVAKSSAAGTTAKKAPAKKVIAKKATATPAAEVTTAPAHEQISQRAYLIWANRGFSHGNHSQDWAQAERELKRA